MARPKKSTKPVEPKVIAVRCSPEWAAWVEELAKANRATVAGIIDRALFELAKSLEFPKPPPER